MIAAEVNERVEELTAAIQPPVIGQRRRVRRCALGVKTKTYWRPSTMETF